MSAEPEVVVGRDADLAPTGLIRGDIEVAFRVGGLVIDRGRNDPGLDRFQAENAFQCAGGAERVADGAFGAADGNLPGGLAERFFDCKGLVFVIESSAGAVRVDVIDLIGTDAGVPHGDPERFRIALAFGVGTGDVEPIAGGAVADHFAEDDRAASAGVFELFQHEHAGTFGGDEAVAVEVERTARMLRIVIAGAECAEGIETADAEFLDGGFRAAGQHDVRVVAADDVIRLADGMAAGGAGGNDAEIRTFELITDRQLAGSHVADHPRDQKRGKPSGSVGGDGSCSLGDGAEAAGSGGDETARPAGIDAARAEIAGDVRLMHRLVGGNDRELNETFQMASLFFGEIPAEIQVMDLTADPGLVPGSVEQSDRTDPAFARDQILPGLLHAVANTADCAAARNDNSSPAHADVFHIRLKSYFQR